MDETTLNNKFGLTRPGDRLVGEDADLAWKSERLLNLIEHEYDRAVAAFAMFDPNFIGQGEYERCLKEIYAREFVLSLDSITNLLETLRNSLSPPRAVKQLIRSYVAVYGYLKHIRDSIAHIEDRGRGRDKNDKPLATKVVVISCFADRKYLFTGADGKQHSVGIEDGTLLAVKSILQSIFDSYSWEGTNLDKILSEINTKLNQDTGAQ